MKKKILTVFDDPGGGLAVTAVAEKLKQYPEVEIVIYSGKLSESIAEKAGLEFIKIDSMISKETAAEVINTVSPDLLLTATGGGNTEQLFRNYAYSKDIPSVVILDFWKDYKRRWKYADHELSDLSDKICVMDELTKTVMTDEGFPENNIEVTGQPYLDKIFNNNKSVSDKSKNELVNILFLSQPLDIIGIRDYKIHPFKILADAVSEYSEKSGREISLKIKLHPSEKMTEELSDIIDKKKVNSVSINITDKKDELETLIKESDIVFGYNSIALFDARALGKRVVSLNLFPMNESLKRAFVGAGIDSSEGKTVSLSLILNNENVSEQTGNIFKGGIENCLNVINKELKIKEQAV